jgi:phosphate-selective porin OprO and OprP
LGEETLLRAPDEREEERRAAKPAMTETPMAGVVTFRDGRPTLTSSDGRMSLAIGEQFQYDVGGYFQNRHSGVFQPPGARELNDGENLRRGRIYFVATFDNWTLRVTPDFGGFPDGAPTLFEGNLNYTIDPVTFTIGYFKPYDTLARSQFPADALFMERPSSALIASNVADGIRRASAGFKAATEDYFIASYLTGQFYGAQMPVFLNDTRRQVARCGLPPVSSVARIGPARGILRLESVPLQRQHLSAGRHGARHSAQRPAGAAD